MIFHISLIHQIKNLFIQSPKKPSSVENTHQNGMIDFTRLIQFGHKFAQEITVYVISMANLRHNHEAMNKMNIIQVANLHLHCWSGEQTKFQGKHTLE